MGFYRKPKPSPDEVRLALAIVDNEVVATLAGPLNQPSGVVVENVPVANAVRLAAELSAHFQTNVAVVDPHDLWHR